jgi:hypothetical protein
MTIRRFDNVIDEADYAEIRKSKSSGLVFDRDVGCTVFLAFVLVALFMVGAGTSAFAYLRVAGLKGDVLIIAGGILSVASFVAFAFFVYSLDRYFYRPEDIEYYERDKPIERPARYEVQVAPRTTRLGRYEWTPLQWQQLAQRCWHNGDWAAGTHFRRKHVEGIVTNVTENWPVVLVDFKDWWWVDLDGRWLDAGKDAIREYLPTP